MLDFERACLELRRSGGLLKEGKITRAEWCGSVQRIIAAFERGRAGS